MKKRDYIFLSFLALLIVIPYLLPKPKHTTKTVKELDDEFYTREAERAKQIHDSENNIIYTKQ